MSAPVYSKTEQLKKFRELHEEFKGSQEAGDIVGSIVCASAALFTFDGLAIDAVGREVKAMVADCDKYLSKVKIDDMEAQRQFKENPMNANEVMMTMCAMTDPILAPSSSARVYDSNSRIIGKMVELSRYRISLNQALEIQSLIEEDGLRYAAFRGSNSHRMILEIIDLKIKAAEMEVDQDKREAAFMVSHFLEKKWRRGRENWRPIY